MALFDLHVRLIPDKTELTKALRENQKKSFGGMVGGSGGGGGIGGMLAKPKELAISGFGKLLGWVGIIAMLIEALDFLIKPVMNILKAIMMLLFLPLVPILKPVMQALGEFIKWFAPVMTKVAGWVEEFVKKIGEGVTWIWENLLKPIWDGLLAAFEVLFIIGKWIWDNIIVPAFTPLLEMGKQILELIKKFFVGQINVVKEVWGYIKAFFKGEIGVKELVWGLIKSLFKGVINVVELVWGYIKTLFSGTINVASTVWEWFKGLFSQGGNYSSRYSRVGDAIIRPNGDVIQTDPNDTIFATKNPGGMGGAITININNPSVRNDQDIRNLAQEVSRVLASQGKRAFS